MKKVSREKICRKQSNSCTWANTWRSQNICK